MLLCLYTAILEQLESKRLSVGTFANTYYSMLGQQNVKNVVIKIPIRVSFVQNYPWHFFCEMNTVCLIGEIAF